MRELKERATVVSWLAVPEEAAALLRPPRLPGTQLVAVLHSCPCYLKMQQHESSPTAGALN